MANFSNRSLSFALLATFIGAMPLCQAATEKYSATVNDGTAHVIRPGKKAASLPTEEYLEDLAPAAPQPKKLRAPSKISAHSKSEDTVSDTAEIRRERGTYKKRVEEAEQAQVEQDATLIPAAQVDEDMAALNPDDAVELNADEANKGPDTTAVERAEEEAVASDDAQTDDVVAPLESRVAEKAVVRATVAKKQQAKSFDVVPDKRISEIAHRLKYANEILKRWGRAYDYRSVTLTQFKKIVAELEATDENSQSVN